MIRPLKRFEPGRRCSFCDGLIPAGTGWRYVLSERLTVWVHEGCAEDGGYGDLDHEHMRRGLPPAPEVLA